MKEAIETDHGVHGRQAARSTDPKTRPPGYIEAATPVSTDFIWLVG